MKSRDQSLTRGWLGIRSGASMSACGASSNLVVYPGVPVPVKTSRREEVNSSSSVQTGRKNIQDAGAMYQHIPVRFKNFLAC